MKVYDSTNLSTIVGNLNEFTSYTFQLSANTIVGGGPAANAMAMTDEDGRHYISKTIAAGLMLVFGISINMVLSLVWFCL